MMHMMNNDGMAYGLNALWSAHALSVVIFLAGLVLLALWSAKTLSQSQLKTWGFGLAIVGALLCLLTISVKGSPWGGAGAYKCGGDGSMSCCNMMNGMDDDEMEMDDMKMGGMMGGMNHSMEMDGDDMMSMSMDDMASMLEGKTGDAFDKAFLEGMIPHHQGAIDMARAAQSSAKHQEIKNMAEDIISAQQREIDMMRQWMRDWGYTE